MNEDYSREIAKIRARYDDAKYSEYHKAWELSGHQVFDVSVRPDSKIVYEEEIEDGYGATRKEKRTELRAVNRIGLPVEQDIVDIQTSFCVGIDPELGAKPEDDLERAMLEIIEATNKKNKISNRNREVVRSFLSETMVAEYWFPVDEKGFYRKHKYSAKKRLKMVVWSPFRGDKMVSIKDATGDLVRFLRFYEIERDGRTVQKAMDIDDTSVKELELDKSWQVVSEYKHGFDKMPVIYMERKEPVYWKIKHIRERLEKLHSNYGDTIDENSAPMVLSRGDMTGLMKSGKTQIVEMTGDSSLDYLTWDQSPESVALEMEKLLDYMYQFTKTPRVSLKDMQGAGNGFSGESFKYVFMGAHMEVRNHEEQIGEYLQRRYNFLLSAVASMIPELEEAQYMEIEPKLIPYIIERDEEGEKTKEGEQ